LETLTTFGNFRETRRKVIISFYYKYVEWKKTGKTGNFRQQSEKTYEKYYKTVLKNYVRKTKRKIQKNLEKGMKNIIEFF